MFRSAVMSALAVFALGVVLASVGGRVASVAAEPAATFAKDVAPILHAKCVNCHRAGEVAPMSLVTYEDARPWIRAIKTGERAADAAVVCRPGDRIVCE